MNLDIEPQCPTCGKDRGAPNVLMASRVYEQDALVARTQAALADADRRGCLERVLAFAHAVLGSMAVVNVPALFARTLLEDERILYVGYEKQTEASVRSPAKDEHDRERLTVGGQLYGTHASQIVYAALTLDGRGLLSYGPVSLVLRNVAIEHRASLLEENSYFFIRRHGSAGVALLPAGYRTPWETRDLLAVAKLATRMDLSTDQEQFARLLLRPGAREEDEYIEVTIYRGFDRSAVERISLPPPNTPGVRNIDLKLLKSTARRLGIALEPS